MVGLCWTLSYDWACQTDMFWFWFQMGSHLPKFGIIPSQNWPMLSKCDEFGDQATYSTTVQPESGGSCPHSGFPNSRAGPFFSVSHRLVGKSKWPADIFPKLWGIIIQSHDQPDQPYFQESSAKLLAGSHATARLWTWCWMDWEPGAPAAGHLAPFEQMDFMGTWDMT